MRTDISKDVSRTLYINRPAKLANQWLCICFVNQN